METNFASHNLLIISSKDKKNGGSHCARNPAVPFPYMFKYDNKDKYRETLVPIYK